MQPKALCLSAALTALLATACGAATPDAQSPFGATPSSDGTNISSKANADDAPTATGPTPSPIDGPEPPTTDGMTPVIAKGAHEPTKKAAPVNTSGSADSAPDMNSR